MRKPSGRSLASWVVIGVMTDRGVIPDLHGRLEAAAARKLWICLSGPHAAKDRVQPILRALGQGIFDFGEEPGAANVVKPAGNFLLASAIEALAEALTLAEKNGIDRTKVAAMLGQTLFASPAYQIYGEAIAQEHYQPADFTVSLGVEGYQSGVADGGRQHHAHACGEPGA